MSISLSKSEWDHWCNKYGESDQIKIGFCRDNNHSKREIKPFIIAEKISYLRKPGRRKSAVFAFQISRSDA